MELSEIKERTHTEILELHQEMMKLDQELGLERGLKHEAIIKSGFTHVTYYNMLRDGKGRIRNMIKMRDAMKSVIKEIQES